MIAQRHERRIRVQREAGTYAGGAEQGLITHQGAVLRAHEVHEVVTGSGEGRSGARLQVNIGATLAVGYTLFPAAPV